MLFTTLSNLGTDQLNFHSENKVRLLNIISIITVGISSLYTLSYFTVLNHLGVGVINAGFTLAYALTMVFNRLHLHKPAKIWFFSILMFHLFICTNVYLTNASGFHLFYFLVPTGVFLLFELREKVDKIVLSVISVLLFFYCENTLNATPLIALSESENHFLYQSVIFFNMLEVIVVLSLFSSKIEQNEALLTKQAQTDSLTGIANRHHFFKQGTSLLLDAHSQQLHLCVALLDFDHFKSINDNHGHHNGDRCLKQITQLIKNNIRSSDLFARIGGEEFALVLPDTKLDEAKQIADKIRHLISEKNISLDNGDNVVCTISVGIYAKQQPDKDIKTLLVNADNALYQAKALGRNRVSFYQKAP
ncbi:GGDEF domain-containing protein [Alginatibacterium sediminis]|uniref:diguanylate cyclase n=1 Tax=Alginatibacterium sediminis TaxID=2164068 RepID=A0A420E7P7_9ALTE|nr:GGDEF domain-containing protein [Alginatibacterium sediminis]RKF14478.1 GGDEF domain-containing protein [Alginatibacterium sediminis]